MDYRAIPGQAGGASVNLPTDDLSLMARERASNLLMPYGEQFGLNRPIVPSPAPTGALAPGAVAPGAVSPAMAPGSASIEDKLYQSIHPDTFAKVLETIMQFVTGRPIPRQAGGEVDPGKEYTVGEAGPEKFRPAVPGEIIPAEPFGPTQKRLAYAGEVPSAGRTALDLAAGVISPTLPLALRMGERMVERTGEKLRSDVGPGGGRWTPEGGFIAPPYTGPAPWRNKKTLPVPTSGGEGGGEGWQNYSPEGQPTGIRFKYSGPETAATRAGDEAARLAIPTPEQNVARYGIPAPRLSYYDVHPEEKAAQEVYDMMRGPSPSSYEAGVERMKEMNLMDIAKNPNTTQQARLAATEQLTELRKGRADRQLMAEKAAGEVYGKSLEHGAGTPGSQEKLAHAEYLRTMPEVHLQGISEQGRVHLEGINRTVAGHLEAARIAAEVKDPVMKEIGVILSQGQKMSELYGTPFDPQKAIASTLKVYRALGVLTDEQWNKLPAEYKEKQWTEQSLRADLKANKMPDKDIETYIKRAKAAGKV